MRSAAGSGSGLSTATNRLRLAATKFHRSRSATECLPWVARRPRTGRVRRQAAMTDIMVASSCPSHASAILLILLVMTGCGGGGGGVVVPAAGQRASTTAGAAGRHDAHGSPGDGANAFQLHVSRRAGGSDRLCKCRGGTASRHQPDEPEPPRRRLAAGSNVRRRCARPGDRSLGRRRSDLESAAAGAVYPVRRRFVRPRLRPLGCRQQFRDHPDRHCLQRCDALGGRTEHGAREPIR